MPWLSVVIPVRNEAAGIVQVLMPLQALRDELEIILVDGGSTDGTLELAGPLADHAITSLPGRARQMNAGAAQAGGEVLLFLHADTLLPAGFVGMIRKAMHNPAVLNPTMDPRLRGDDVAGERGVSVTGTAPPLYPVIPAHAGIHVDLPTQHQWGRFNVELAPSSPALKLIAWMMNHRSRLTGICTGDQAIFVRRDLFHQLGGYADIALMEDIEFTSRLNRTGPAACIRQPLTTSSRRWQQNGVLRTMAFMWWLRLQYWLGVSPARLAKKYYPARPNTH
jgi:glycosyltransferase involved in cell wall biosynthesis